MDKLKNTSVIISVVIAVVAASIGFWGGMKYQQSRRSPFPNQFTRGQAPSGNMGAGAGEPRQNGNRGQGNQAMGEITNKDEKSITIKMQNGSSKIVFISESTSFTKSTEGSKDDLVVGNKVAVFGTANSDGSITAESVQLNPVANGFIGGETPKQ